MTATPSEGLRERKKRELRQRISDTATGMFLDRGFHQVTVAEVARECGVSQKTVYNYFPTKELLVLDRLEDDEARLRAALSDPSRPVVQAVVDAIVDDVTETFDDPDILELGRATVGRFLAMIQGTPSLRAAQADGTDRLVAIATEALARRAGVDPGDPEPRMAATALIGLYHLHHQAWARFGQGTLELTETVAAILAEVRRAARVLESGLDGWGGTGA